MPRIFFQDVFIFVAPLFMFEVCVSEHLFSTGRILPGKQPYDNGLSNLVDIEFKPVAAVTALKGFDRDFLAADLTVGGALEKQQRDTVLHVQIFRNFTISNNGFHAAGGLG